MKDLQKFLKDTATEIVTLGQKHGYTFTEQDVEALIRQTGELADDQLDGVAGGSDGSWSRI